MLLDTVSPIASADITQPLEVNKKRRLEGDDVFVICYMLTVGWVERQAKPNKSITRVRFCYLNPTYKVN